MEIETAIRVAFASSDRQRVDQHFGAAVAFVIHAIDSHRSRLVEVVQFGPLHQDGNEDKLSVKIAALEGCAAVYCEAIGTSAVNQLRVAGVQPLKVAPGTRIVGDRGRAAAGVAGRTQRLAGAGRRRPAGPGYEPLRRHGGRGVARMKPGLPFRDGTSARMAPRRAVGLIHRLVGARLMIEETAVVVAHEPGIAWVETSRRNACGACSQSAGCGSALLSRLFAPGANRLALEDRLGVAIGERVVIGIPDGLLVRASLIAYLLPLLTLVMGAVLAEWWQLAEIEVALTGIAGLGVGIWLTGHLTGGAQGAPALPPPPAAPRARDPSDPLRFRYRAPRGNPHPRQPNQEVPR